MVTSTLIGHCQSILFEQAWQKEELWGAFLKHTQPILDVSHGAAADRFYLKVWLEFLQVVKLLLNV